MKCEYCDNEVPQGAARCPSCGAAVSQASAQTAAAAAVPAGAPPYVAPVVNVNVQQPAAPAKSRVAYVILAIFLGGIGIHNFYAGYNGRAIVQLLLSVVTCGWGGILTCLWALVEACVVTHDANGVKFS